jgi:hypothetical protein
VPTISVKSQPQPFLKDMDLHEELTNRFDRRHKATLTGEKAGF